MVFCYNSVDLFGGISKRSQRGGLENRLGESPRGFESLSLRHTRHLLKAEKEKRKAVCFPFFSLVKNALPCVASAFGNRTRDAPQGCAIPSQSSLRIPQPPPTRRNTTHVNRRRRYAVSCQFFVGFSFPRNVLRYFGATRTNFFSGVFYVFKNSLF